jgi:hypothetical protein
MAGKLANLRAKSGRVESRKPQRKDGAARRGHSSPAGRERAETSTAAAPVSPLRLYNVRIQLLENGLPLAEGNISVPDFFLGNCVFDAMHSHGLQIASPLYWINRTETYRKHEP